MADRLRVAGFGKRHWELPFPDGPYGEAFRECIPLMGTGAIIMLVGPRGRGKTQLSAAVAGHVLGLRKRAVYTTASELFITLRSSFSNNTSEDDTLKKFTTPDLLVIDEMQVRGGTDYEDRTITTILDRRYRDMRDTILIANLAPEALLEAVGQSVTSRVDECGTVIECTWQNFRKAGK